MDLVTIIGYIASAFVAVSLLVKNTIRFRIYNLTGCTIFIVYGVIINAMPVIVANAILLAINIYQLYKLFRKEEQFHCLEIESDDKIIGYFIAHYLKDMKQFFPKFESLIETKHNLNFIVFRNEVMANIFAANLDGQGNAWIDIDYTIPQFRDLKLGRFLLETNSDMLTQKGVKQLVYKDGLSTAHLHFIQVMGFTLEMINGNKCWVKKVNGQQ